MLVADTAKHLHAAEAQVISTSVEAVRANEWVTRRR